MRTAGEASELRSLRAVDFQLHSQVSHVVPAGENAKNQEQAQQPILQQTAAGLVCWQKREPADRRFGPGCCTKICQNAASGFRGGTCSAARKPLALGFPLASRYIDDFAFAGGSPSSEGPVIDPPFGQQVATGHCENGHSV